MEFGYDEEKKLTKIFVDAQEDVCADCPLIDYCPLLCGIANHTVYPSAQTLIISRCILKDKLLEMDVDVSSDNEQQDY